jgi:hypothetical protein
MNYFKDCKTLDQAKKHYWTLAKEHHPDKGGDEEIFKAVLNQFHEFRPAEEKYSTEYEDWNSHAYADIISQLFNIEDIHIEICGSWIWISGKTKLRKDQIKSINLTEDFKLGFSYKKMMWHISPKGYRKKSKREVSIDKIRKLYGSTNPTQPEKEDNKQPQLIHN